MLNITDLRIAFTNADTGAVYTAVNQLNIEVKEGQVLGIVGESGSGKSVTSLSIMRLLPSENSKITGSIFFKDKDLLLLNEKEMARYRGSQIAMIFQEPMTSLNPVFTCGEQVEEVILLHLRMSREEAKAHVILLFTEVQLPQPELIFSKYPHELSGGQKQRVMIAMALSCNPALLIADEPTTALDVTVQRTILLLLQKVIADRQMSMIFISHDLNVISEIADEIAVMYKGTIVEQGKTQKLLTNPSHPYTKGLVACRPSPLYQLKKLPVVADFLSNDKSHSIKHLLEENSYTAIETKERREHLYKQAPILNVEQLSISYPIKKGLFDRSPSLIKAVDDISFQVYPGETLGLVGESGCGKTTLSRSLLGLIKTSSGKIHYQDKDIAKLSGLELNKLRTEVQLIFQDPYSSLNPRMTVGETLLEPLIVHQLFNSNAERKAHIQHLLSLVDLNVAHINRYPHEFSGGQRQRIVIARALALQPKFIICDESVSALDVSVQAQVLNLLKSLQQELQLTYIFISHDLTVVKHMSDRMMVMNRGRIVEEGFPEAIYENPKSTYTKRLIDAIPGAFIKSI